MKKVLKALKYLDLLGLWINSKLIFVIILEIVIVGFFTFVIYAISSDESIFSDFTKDLITFKSYTISLYLLAATIGAISFNFMNAILYDYKKYKGNSWFDIKYSLGLAIEGKDFVECSNCNELVNCKYYRPDYCPKAEKIPVNF